MSSKENLLFTQESIKIIWEEKDPSLYLSIYLEEYLRKTTGVIDADSNFISTLTEFHLNNLIYLKTIFPIGKDHIIADIMIVLSKLLELADEINNQSFNNNDIATGIDNNKDFKELLTENEDFEGNLSHNKEKVDIVAISKDKINLLKSEFFRLKEKHKDELQIKQISDILCYLNKSFFPFIKLYYYFCNIERDEENQRLDFIINKPLEIYSLNNAISQIDHKEEAEKNEKKKQEEIRLKQEEEQKQAEIKRKTIEHENLKKIEEEEKIKQMKNKEKTYLDLLEELSMNDETKKLIIESIEKMHSEINIKVQDRQKKLEDKLKEMEEIVKGKKK
jgi:hypothetical protein